MTILTDARPTIVRFERDRIDGFAVVALTLSFALAMLGLVLTAHPRPDVETGEAFPVIIAP